MDKSMLLIGFYNEKALGVKYLARELKKQGYRPYIVFFKKLNSKQPSRATDKEIHLLEDLISTLKPSYIGMSVMSSLYLETIYLVNKRLKEKFTIPIIWGGVYPTLFPDRSIQYADYVLRGEGERALVDLLNALDKKLDTSLISNLVYKNKEGRIIRNDVAPLIQNLDELQYPEVGGDHHYLIENDRMTIGDPQLNSFTYELSGSRGCPFACSYCSSINLKRIYKKTKGPYVRFRSVDSIIEELLEAKKKIKNLKVIHFWDEIFSDEEGWIEAFKERYKNEIGIPFRIWGHPLKINDKIISHLVEAGLYQIVVGIQSGSSQIRKEIFHRPETQEQIINISSILSKHKVPKIIYDFMLLHPFETAEDLKETYKLCLQLSPPFELQLHGLNFLPGTDIINMVIEEGIHTEEELEKLMFESTIQEQYDMYWSPTASNGFTSNHVWVALIYLTQFPRLHNMLNKLVTELDAGNRHNTILTLQKIMQQAVRYRNLSQKAKLVFRSY